MDYLNLDPAVGEEVRVRYRPGVFRITQVYRPGEEHPNFHLRTDEGRLNGTVDLRREADGFSLPAIPWNRLTFVDETRPVRRAIDWLKTSPEGQKFPDYVVGYEVTAGDDHAGESAFFVRFIVDPDYLYRDPWPPNEKIAELNKFMEQVQTELLSLDLGRWIYVRAGEARRALDVAS